MEVRGPYYKAGEWLAICDRCGETHRNTGLRLEWTGLRVCRACWEPRHPQEFVQGVADRQAPPWVRPVPPDIDVSPGSGNEVTADDL